MLSGPSVLSALGLYDVAVGGGCPCSDSAWDVYIRFAGSKVQYILAGM